MTVRVSARVERFAVAGAFTISRGARTHVDVVACTLSAPDGAEGLGEGTPVYYRGETAEGCLAQIEAWAVRGGHEDRLRLLAELPPGAARNAIDCALWDLAAKRRGVAVRELAGGGPPAPVPTAMTVSLAAPAKMGDEAAYAANAGYALLKAKLGGDGEDHARIAAIRAAAPAVRLIVDANEALSQANLADELAAMAALGVEMVEQPLPAGNDAALAGIAAPLAVCADESCQTAADLPTLAARYSAVNIKLDKCGGLTAAIELAEAARAAGLDVMLGCMLSTSRAVRPALALARASRWVDLDGPVLLAQDRPGGLRYEKGMILPD